MAEEMVPDVAEVVRVPESEAEADQTETWQDLSPVKRTQETKELCK